MMSVKFWFSSPVPHVHTYVPGVTPRLAKVALLKVMLSDKRIPEMYPFGTISSSKAPIPTRSPLPLSANFTKPLPKSVGPLNPSYRSKEVKLVGPVKICASLATISARPLVKVMPKFSPVKSMAPLSGRYNVGPPLLERNDISRLGERGDN